jgi:hypothetical protein
LHSGRGEGEVLLFKKPFLKNALFILYAIYTVYNADLIELIRILNKQKKLCDAEVFLFDVIPEKINELANALSHQPDEKPERG